MTFYIKNGWSEVPERRRPDNDVDVLFFASLGKTSPLEAFTVDSFIRIASTRHDKERKKHSGESDHYKIKSFHLLILWRWLKRCRPSHLLHFPTQNLHFASQRCRIRGSSF